MPRHQPGILKGANTFAEELHRYVEARNQAVLSQSGGLEQLDVNAIDSETSSSQDLETLGSESDLNSVELEHEQLMDDTEGRMRIGSADTNEVQPLTPQQQMVSPMQETMVPNQAFIMQPPMYNLYSSPTVGQYLSPMNLQMVEAGLLPHYPLMSVANSVAVTTTTATTSSPSPSFTEQYHSDS